MTKIITASIDVKLLNKAKFKPFKKRDGSEALYCELVLIETSGGKFGDWMVKQGSTKQERESGEQTPILGNGKNVVPVGKVVQEVRKSVNAAPESDQSEFGDVPF